MMNSQQKLQPLALDPYCHGYRNEPPPFKVDVYPDALLRLIDDAKHGLRIYELFAIKRLGDIMKYLSKFIMTTQDFGEINLYTQEKRAGVFVYSRFHAKQLEGELLWQRVHTEGNYLRTIRCS
jgi:hypothetical protein